MTTEELLKPRYEVIAEDTSGDLHKGDILKILYDDSIFYPSIGNTGFYVAVLEKFPYLFRKLEWWEHRKPEEMPEYVSKAGDILKVDKYDFDTNTVTVDGGYKFTLLSYLSRSKPATLAEYQQYINSDKL